MGTPSENIARAIETGRATNYAEKARERAAYEKRLRDAAPDLLAALDVAQGIIDAVLHYVPDGPLRKSVLRDEPKIAAAIARVRGEA